MPELRRETLQVPREEVRDRDWSNKLKGKVYADAKRGATSKSIRVGDAVLLEAEKSNKLSTNFRSSPFKVVEKTGSEVTARNEAGVEFKCNTAFVKRYCTVRGWMATQYHSIHSELNMFNNTRHATSKMAPTNTNL